jgi:sterol 24-C-methyltransferase
VTKALFLSVVSLGATAVAVILTVNKALGVNPIGRTMEVLKIFSTQEKNRSLKVDNWIEQYNDLHEGSLDDRNMSYTTLVNAYYELATLFYEWGWGQSFHFAYSLKGETFTTAIARHEYFLAGKLGVNQGDKVLDVGNRITRLFTRKQCFTLNDVVRCL